MLRLLATLLAGVSIVVSAYAEEGLEVTITPEGLSEDQARTLAGLLLEREQVKKRLSGVKYRIVGMDFDDDTPDKGVTIRPRGGFRVQVYDYTNDRMLELSSDARGEVSSMAELDENFEQPAPSPEEFKEAVEILGRDSRYAKAIKSRTLVPYESMPGVLDLRAGNEERRNRVIAVGLMPASSGKGSRKHEIVGVNLSRDEVVRFENGAPPTTLATLYHCGYRYAGQYVTARGTAGRATVNIDRNGTRLWSFTVVRPSASSGREGSAIDLRNIYYKGRLVISQMHVPILNVHYENNICGPYRDWQYQENSFEAYGYNMASGIRRTSQAPRTIFESGSDYGNFRGVAVHHTANSVLLTTELSAAWYRYISEYQFFDDGTIKPIFKFSAVENSCVCRKHFHNVYWRIDFDVDTYEDNQMQYFDGVAWRNIAAEAKQLKSASVRNWRVLNTASGRGVTVTPGSNDGTADSYARGDAWTLRYSAYELEDSRVRTSTMAALDSFVNGQSVANTDLVFWYSGHFTHDSGDESVPHMIGPTLKVF